MFYAVQGMDHTAFRAYNGERARTILEDNADIDLIVADIQAAIARYLKS